MTKCKECGHQVSTKARACPGCGAKLPVQVSWQMTVFSLIVLVPGLIWFMAQNDKNDAPTSLSGSDDVPVVRAPSEEQQKSPMPTADTPLAASPQFLTTAADLAHAYSANAVAADNQFKGKRFEIIGIVYSVTTDILNNVNVALLNPENEFLSPSAALEDSERQKAATLKKGQHISLICTGNGDITTTAMLNNCVIRNQEHENNSIASTSNKEKTTLQTTESTPDPAIVQPDQFAHPSFDCSKARSDAEKLICSDKGLAILDNELASLYKEARNASANKDAFYAENQVEWKNREENCHDKECVLKWYARRKQQLEDVIQKP